MARLGFTISSGLVAWAATAKTAWTITAPANQRVIFKGLKMFGQGTSNTDKPLQVELMTYASIAGGTAGTVVTTKKESELSETIQSVIAGNYSAEPTYTTGVTIENFTLHPQLANALWWPLGTEYVIKGGTGMAVRITSAQADTAGFQGEFEE